MMKEEFECAIDQCGLPLKMDEATQGGNCWVRAVKEQLERPELGKQLNNRTKAILKVSKQNIHLKLKYDIAEFATTSSYPTILKDK